MNFAFPALLLWLMLPSALTRGSFTGMVLYMQHYLFVYAEKIPFVWHTEYNNKDTVVPVEWNEKWFGQKSFFEYNHDIARIACFFSVAAYSDAEKDVHLMNYSLLGISNKDVELNYNMNYTDQKKNSPRKRALKLLRKADHKNL